MNYKEYDRILKEHFDCNHTETRQIMVSIDEADQNQLLTSLTAKLYDHIVNKIDDIDFGTIPNSKGDITKIEHYEDMVNCLGVIKQYLTEAKQDTTTVDSVQEAIENLKSRAEVFNKGFVANLEFVMVTYCSLALAVVSSVSFLISSCIEFIKNPSDDTFSITVDKVALQKTKQSLLFSNLTKFNASCKKGDFDKAIDYIFSSSSKQLVGGTGAVVGGIALGIIILNIIPILRELIFFFYHARTSVSDYFEIQADLLQMNAYNLDNNTNLTAKQSKEIAGKQMKIVTIFRKIANTLSITNKQADNKASKDISDSKKYKANELTDSLPSSASTSSSLF